MDWTVEIAALLKEQLDSSTSNKRRAEIEARLMQYRCSIEFAGYAMEALCRSDDTALLLFCVNSIEGLIQAGILDFCDCDSSQFGNKLFHAAECIQKQTSVAPFILAKIADLIALVVVNRWSEESACAVQSLVEKEQWFSFGMSVLSGFARFVGAGYGEELHQVRNFLETKVFSTTCRLVTAELEAMVCKKNRYTFDDKKLLIGSALLKEIVALPDTNVDFAQLSPVVDICLSIARCGLREWSAAVLESLSSLLCVVTSKCRFSEAELLDKLFAIAFTPDGSFSVYAHEVISKVQAKLLVVSFTLQRSAAKLLDAVLHITVATAKASGLRQLLKTIWLPFFDLHFSSNETRQLISKSFVKQLYKALVYKDNIISGLDFSTLIGDLLMVNMDDQAELCDDDTDIELSGSAYIFGIGKLFNKISSISPDETFACATDFYAASMKEEMCAINSHILSRLGHCRSQKSGAVNSETAEINLLETTLGIVEESLGQAKLPWPNTLNGLFQYNIVCSALIVSTSRCEWISQAYYKRLTSAEDTSDVDAVITRAIALSLKCLSASKPTVLHTVHHAFEQCALNLLSAVLLMVRPNAFVLEQTEFLDFVSALASGDAKLEKKRFYQALRVMCSYLIAPWKGIKEDEQFRMTRHFLFSNFASSTTSKLHDWLVSGVGVGAVDGQKHLNEVADLLKRLNIMLECGRNQNSDTLRAMLNALPMEGFRMTGTVFTSLLQSRNGDVLPLAELLSNHLREAFLTFSSLKDTLWKESLLETWLPTLDLFYSFCQFHDPAIQDTPLEVMVENHFIMLTCAIQNIHGDTFLSGLYQIFTSERVVEVFAKSSSTIIRKALYDALAEFFKSNFTAFSCSSVIAKPLEVIEQRKQMLVTVISLSIPRAFAEGSEPETVRQAISILHLLRKRIHFYATEAFAEVVSTILNSLVFAYLAQLFPSQTDELLDVLFDIFEAVFNSFHLFAPCVEQAIQRFAHLDAAVTLDLSSDVYTRQMDRVHFAIAMDSLRKLIRRAALETRSVAFLAEQTRRFHIS